MTVQIGPSPMQLAHWLLMYLRLNQRAWESIRGWFNGPVPQPSSYATRWAAVEVHKAEAARLRCMLDAERERQRQTERWLALAVRKFEVTAEVMKDDGHR